MMNEATFYRLLLAPFEIPLRAMTMLTTPPKQETQEVQPPVKERWVMGRGQRMTEGQVYPTAELQRVPDTTKNNTLIL